jgi:hypothetical protein
MKSLHKISSKPTSFYSAFVRGGRSIASSSKAFLPLNLIVKKPEPILSVLQLRKELSKTALSPFFSRFSRSSAFPAIREDDLSKLSVDFFPALSRNSHQASNGVFITGSMASSRSHHYQTLPPLPFLSELPYQQCYETLESFSSLEKISVIRGVPVITTKVLTEVSSCFYPKKLNALSTHSPGECLTSTSQQRSLLSPPELSVDQDFFCMNRNARHPRRANHGKRPCSRQNRRARRRRFGNHRR